MARAIVTNPALILADEPTGNLDSASSVDVMSAFAGLHAQGRTVVMITHEEDIAAYATRVVRFRDGSISQDHHQSRSTPTTSHLAQCASGTLRTGGAAAMSILANTLMALRGISSNKLRSLLTMLGVLIGVAAVIVLLAVGTGSSRAVANSHRQLGHEHIDGLQRRADSAVAPRRREPRPATPF